MKTISKLFLTIAVVFFAQLVYADDYKTSTFNPVEHAVISQTIAPDARAAGMGDVGCATDPDVNSQAWNLAKYPFCISRAGIALNYTPWLRQLVNDIDLAYVAGYYRIGDRGALSGSLRYFSLGEVYTDINGEDASMTVKPYEMSLDAAYSMMLSETFSFGVGLRWIYSDLRYDYSEDSKPASAFAADIAFYYNNYIMMGNRECQLGLGLTTTNIGSKISYYGDEESQFIPANLRLGASLMVPVDEWNRFSIAADANKLLVPTVPVQGVDENNSDYQDRVRREYSDVSSISGIFKSFSDAPGGFKEEMEEIQWSVGAEYVYHDQFSLRAGYHHESESKGNRKYFTVGGGFRMNVFSLDVGYVISTAQSNPLDQTLRFTLAFDMDGIKDLFK
ncbi:type IX secretion system outer membrane channel protein PorV [Prevotella sp. E9-3]|uniref:type IX secretion system outer membrane channel protein PorV n=1 Tax=Prevotella sp. E9-3 TaxID=2913621 RepID=UPI001EDABD28|nr:type IX secretion system outer membrane channel protein PorV [Prevotella sp. E9-3]UKK48096.1 type IX secretion system outer membrane channel protein PorV [Prevotella sp. E9-3]